MLTDEQKIAINQAREGIRVAVRAIESSFGIDSHPAAIRLTAAMVEVDKLERL